GWATAEQDALRLERVLARRPPADDFFSGAAGRWDRLRDELYGRTFGQEAFLALLDPRWVVADLACGTGPATAALAPFVRRVIGVDQSAAMLKAARRRTGGFGNVELRRGRPGGLPPEPPRRGAAPLLLAPPPLGGPAPRLRGAARALRPR